MLSREVLWGAALGLAAFAGFVAGVVWDQVGMHGRVVGFGAGR